MREHRIGRGRSIALGNAVEAVDLDQADAETFLVAARAAHLLIEPQVEVLAVVGARQPIADGHLAHLEKALQVPADGGEQIARLEGARHQIGGARPQRAGAQLRIGARRNEDGRHLQQRMRAQLAAQLERVHDDQVGHLQRDAVERPVGLAGGEGESGRAEHFARQPGVDRIGIDHQQVRGGRSVAARPAGILAGPRTTFEHRGRSGQAFAQSEHRLLGRVAFDERFGRALASRAQPREKREVDRFGSVRHPAKEVSQLLRGLRIIRVLAQLLVRLLRAGMTAAQLPEEDELELEVVVGRWIDRHGFQV